MKYKKPVWLDTDISLGQEHAPGFYRDIDDGLAMIALFNSRTIELRGVSTTFGNTDTDSSYRIATDLVSRFGPDGLQVYHGADVPIKDCDQLPSSDGAEALAAALRQGRLRILSLGAATNIAIVIQKYPELVNQIEELVAMAGARTGPEEQFLVGPKQKKPFTALNFEADVEAWRIILASNVPITFIPFRCSHQIWLTKEDGAEVGGGSETGRFLRPYMERWAGQWAWEYGAPGFNPFDALAAGYLLAPDMFAVEMLPVCIKRCHNHDEPHLLDKLPLHKDYLLVSNDFIGYRRVQWCSEVNQEFKPYLLSMLKGGWNMAVELLALSHVNIVVDDLDKATEFYHRTMGFVIASNKDGLIDFPHYTSVPFAKDAGFLDGKVDVDIRFLKHPQAGIYLELMVYHYPPGAKEVSRFAINDLGGPRHVAIEVEFTSPGGQGPALTGTDFKDPALVRLLSDGALMARITGAPAPETVDADRYQAIFYTGGHGGLYDFPDNPALIDVAEAIYGRGGIVAAMCHGPAGLLNLKDASGDPLIANRRLTGYSRAEEIFYGTLFDIPFVLQDRLTEVGGRYSCYGVNQGYVQQDGRVITGQNPMSSQAVGEQIATAVLKGLQ